MPSLDIRLLLKPGSQLFGVPIAVEVVDSELEIRWRGAIPLGQSVTTADLESGRYSVQASLPGGRRLSNAVTLAADRDSEVEIKVVSPSLSESLEWVKLRKPEALARAEGGEEWLRSVWVRLWAGGPDGRWQVQLWPTQKAVRSPGLVQYEFDFGNPGRFGQYYLQIGGPKMQWRLVALPADDIRVLIGARPAVPSSPAMADEVDGVVEVAVTSKKQDTEILLSHLSQGEIEQAKVIGDHVIATDLLYGKRKNPMAAAIAGYFLLARGELENVHRVWTHNLSNWITWLPDGAVINAWYCMRADPPDLKGARRQLLEAAARGVPVYTRGLRLLVDGLALFADDKQHGGPDVSAALKRVRRFAAETEWGAPTTTFIGEDPCSPGKRKIGKPDDPQGVVFLTGPDENDLAWQRQSTRRGTSTRRGGTVFGQTYADPTSLTKESIPGMDSLPESEAERAEARSTSLGETQEAGVTPSDTGPPMTTAPLVPSYHLPPEVLNSYTQFEAPRAGGRAPRPRSLDTDERTIARLFRAADAQTQGEQMQDMNPVTLSPDADESAALRGLALERIMGVSDLLSVSFLERGLAAARTVGRVGVGGVGGHPTFYATGFLVSPHLLLTAAHVVDSHEQAQACFVDFNYQDGPDGRLLPPTRIDFDPDTFFVTSLELDFTLVALNFPGPGRKFGWNHLSDEQGKILIGEYVSIVQHAEGGPKQVSLRENQLVGSVENFLHYRSETAQPASGAPLYNDQWEVVGMHQASVPALNPAGDVLAVDGIVWSPAAGAPDLQIPVHEGVRVSSIVRFLRDYKLPAHAAALRDELLFLKPPQ